MQPIDRKYGLKVSVRCYGNHLPRKKPINKAHDLRQEAVYACLDEQYPEI